jgi:tetratricopeptide (TPR) repeat protein
MGDPGDTAPSGAWQEPDELLSRLWRQGHGPDVAAFLAGAGTLSPAQLVAVLAVDQQRRWQAGERVPAEEYLRQYPALASNTEAALELVCREFLLRQELRENPDVEEYGRRYPLLAERLRQQIELHRALEAAAGHTAPDSGQTAFPTAVRAPDRTTLYPSLPGVMPAGLPLPHVLGYELIEELGRGGMGVVYKAWQPRLNRLVALKMILAGAHAGPQELARFRIEVEAAGRLQHPNIVAVYEVSQPGDPPFLVMEFVDGGSLDKKLDGTPLPAPVAAGLLETLSRAVHHAHQRAIVHRDLKPANVLLQKDEGGRMKDESDPFFGSSFLPKITDFGVAKLLKGGDSGQTPPGAVLGTPSYMAPEQAAGRGTDIGPPTDVYALGAILYETLTGRPPFKSTTVADTLRQVLTQDPVPPARLQPKVPRDLQTICLKCLEKEPRKRYASALELAEDLRRYRGGEPIRARPTGAWGRAVKWARRRPAAAALVGLSATIVLGLSAGGWWYSAEMRAAAQREEQQRLAAEENFRLALAAVDEMLTEVGAVDLADVPQMEPVREKVLQRAVGFFQQFLARRGSDPAVRHEAARVHARLGDVLALLRKQEEAEQAYRQALNFLAAGPAGDDLRRERARTCNNLGILLQDCKRFDEAEAVLGQARDLWAELAADNDPECQACLAGSYYYLGAVLAHQLGREKEAERAYDEALRRQRRLAAGSQQPEYRRSLARTLNNVGLLYKRLGRPGAARPFEDAAVIQEELTRTYPDVPAYRRELARSHSNRGAVLAEARQSAAALQAYLLAADLLGQLARDFPRVPVYRQEWSSVRTNLGMLWQAMRRPGDAEAALRDALRVRTALAREFPRVPDHRHKLAEAHRRLGILLWETGRAAEAERAYRQALDIGRELTDHHGTEADYQLTLAWTLSNLGQLLLARSEQECKLVAPLGTPWAALGPLARARADLNEACECFDQAVARQTALGSSLREPRHRQFLRNDCWYRAECLVRLGRYAEVAPVAERLPRLCADRPEEGVVAAGFLARCLPALARDDRLTAARRQELAADCTRRAMTLLREAVRQGYRNANALRDPAFDALRPLPEFRQLLDELRQQQEHAAG